MTALRFRLANSRIARRFERPPLHESERDRRDAWWLVWLAAVMTAVAVLVGCADPPPAQPVDWARVDPPERLDHEHAFPPERIRWQGYDYRLEGQMVSGFQSVDGALRASNGKTYREMVGCWPGDPNTTKMEAFLEKDGSIFLQCSTK